MQYRQWTNAETAVTWSMLSLLKKDNVIRRAIPLSACSYYKSSTETVMRLKALKALTVMRLRALFVNPRQQIDYKLMSAACRSRHPRLSPLVLGLLHTATNDTCVVQNRKLTYAAAVTITFEL